MRHIEQISDVCEVEYNDTTGELKIIHDSDVIYTLTPKSVQNLFSFMESMLPYINNRTHHLKE